MVPETSTLVEEGSFVIGVKVHVVVAKSNLVDWMFPVLSVKLATIALEGVSRWTIF